MKFRKSLSSGILSVALVTSMVVATPSSSLASTHLLPVSNQLAAAGASLAQAGMLTELLPTIDGFGTNPALVLGLHEAFGDLADLAGEADLETAIEALGGGSGFVYDFVSDNLTGDVRTVTFTLAANRSVDIPLMAMSDDVQIVGDDVTATVTLAPTTVTIELDESNPADPAAFAFTNLPPSPSPPPSTSLSPAQRPSPSSSASPRRLLPAHCTSVSEPMSHSSTPTASTA